MGFPTEYESTRSSLGLLDLAPDHAEELLREIFAPSQDTSHKGATIVGLVLNQERTIVGTVLAKEFLSYQSEVRKQDKVARYDDEVTGSAESPTSGKPYFQLIMSRIAGSNAVGPGEAITLKGRNFKPGVDLAIELDDHPAQRVTVQANGTFDTEIHAPAEFSVHRVTVRDKTTAKIIDGATFFVRLGEKEGGSKESEPQ
jgi:hypothetical protein